MWAKNQNYYIKKYTRCIFYTLARSTSFIFSLFHSLRINQLSAQITFRGICLFLFYICLLSNDVRAAGSAGTSGADFLEIGVGSRALGMGEAFAAMVGDVSAVYYNPAGLGTLRYPVLSLMHQELILDSRFENISAAFPVYDGFLGVSHSLFWVPPFDRIDIEGNTTGTVQFYNSSGTVAYGISLGFMEVGAGLKYIYQKIDTLAIHSAAVDIGILKRLYIYSPFNAPTRNFSVGIALQNFGTKALESPLPRTIRFGTSYSPTKWLTINMDMIESAISPSDLYDFTYGFEESFRINLGLEANYNELMFVRGGYRFNDAGKYAIGMGFNYQVSEVNFTVDASYSDAGIFGPVYSFTVGAKLTLKVITIEDTLEAEKHYQEGIKKYVKKDVDGAIEEFEKARRLNRYHKNINQKLRDLRALKNLMEESEKLEKELEKYRKD